MTEQKPRTSSAKDASSTRKVCDVCRSSRWCGNPCQNHVEGRALAAARGLAVTPTKKTKRKKK